MVGRLSFEGGSFPDGSIVGVLLAGGLARRMGGGDKALVTLGGAPLLSHVIARAAPQVSDLVLNANGDAGRFAGFGLPVAADTVEGFVGPLAGILAGLEWAARHVPEAQAVVSFPTDTPFFPSDLVARLQASAQGGLACAASGGRTHPVIGIWPLALRDALRRALIEDGVRKIDRWTAEFGCAEVLFDQEGNLDPFFNVNTPEDLSLAEATLRAQLPQGRQSRSAGQGRSDQQKPSSAHNSNPAQAPQRLFGIVGWKDAGKTTLVERLVRELTGRGFTVSTVKHAHHNAQVDHKGRDSYRHREAGATETALVTPNRWALMHENRGEPEIELEAMLEHLTRVDLVLIEGFKTAPHPKLEVRLAAQTDDPQLKGRIKNVVAIATDNPGALESANKNAPVFDRDDIERIADLIVSFTGLAEEQSRQGATR